MALVTERIDFILDNSLKRGVAYKLPFTIKDDGKPIDLSNLVASCKVKKFYDSVVPVYVPEVSMIDPVNGRIDLVFDSNTKVIKPGRYYYDIFFTNLNGKEFSFIEVQIDFSWSASHG